MKDGNMSYFREYSIGSENHRTYYYSDDKFQNLLEDAPCIVWKSGAKLWKRDGQFNKIQLPSQNGIPGEVLEIQADGKFLTKYGPAVLYYPTCLDTQLLFGKDNPGLHSLEFSGKMKYNWFNHILLENEYNNRLKNNIITKEGYNLYYNYSKSEIKLVKWETGWQVFFKEFPHLNSEFGDLYQIIAPDGKSINLKEVIFNPKELNKSYHQIDLGSGAFRRDYFNGDQEWYDRREFEGGSVPPEYQDGEPASAAKGLSKASDFEQLCKPELHRLDGPASIRNGTGHYYVYGVEVAKEKWHQPRIPSFYPNIPRVIIAPNENSGLVVFKNKIQVSITGSIVNEIKFPDGTTWKKDSLAHWVCSDPNQKGYFIGESPTGYLKITNKDNAFIIKYLNGNIEYFVNQSACTKEQYDNYASSIIEDPGTPAERQYFSNPINGEANVIWKNGHKVWHNAGVISKVQLSTGEIFEGETLITHLPLTAPTKPVLCLRSNSRDYYVIYPTEDHGLLEKKLTGEETYSWFGQRISKLEYDFALNNLISPRERVGLGSAEKRFAYFSKKTAKYEHQSGWQTWFSPEGDVLKIKRPTGEIISNWTKKDEKWYSPELPGQYLLNWDTNIPSLVTQTKDNLHIAWFNGDEQWKTNNQLHRENGPAEILQNGTIRYYLDGTLYSKEDWEKEITIRKSKIELSNGTQWNLSRDEIKFQFKNGITIWYKDTIPIRVKLSDGQEIVDPTMKGGWITVSSENNQEHRIHAFQGTEEFRFHGQLHRTNGPAYHLGSGYQEWHQFGRLHRADGPAILKDSQELYYLNGIEYSKALCEKRDKTCEAILDANTPAERYEFAVKDNLPDLVWKNGHKIYRRRINGCWTLRAELATGEVIENSQSYWEDKSKDEIDFSKPYLYYHNKESVVYYPVQDHGLTRRMLTGQEFYTWFDEKDLSKKDYENRLAKLLKSEIFDYNITKNTYKDSNNNIIKIEYSSGYSITLDKNNHPLMVITPDQETLTGWEPYNEGWVTDQKPGYVLQLSYGYDKLIQNNKIIFMDGEVRIYKENTKNTILHCETGPAIIKPNKTEEYWLDGCYYSKQKWEEIITARSEAKNPKLVSENLYQKTTGTLQEFFSDPNGTIRHREDGPAMIDGSNFAYFLNNTPFSEQEWQEKLNKPWLTETTSYRPNLPEVPPEHLAILFPTQYFGTRNLGTSQEKTVYFSDPAGTILHREDGPAVIHKDGSQEFWFQDTKLSERDWLNKVKEKREIKPDYFISKSFLSTNYQWTEIKYFTDRQIHREDGPAVIRANGDLEWWINGCIHREDGPAYQYANGAYGYMIHGLYHRENGPARRDGDGNLYWYQHNKLHRVEGPAIVPPVGEELYYLMDKNLSKQDWIIQRLKYLPQSLPPRLALSQINHQLDSVLPTPKTKAILQYALGASHLLPPAFSKECRVAALTTLGENFLNDLTREVKNQLQATFGTKSTKIESPPRELTLKWQPNEDKDLLYVIDQKWNEL